MNDTIKIGLPMEYEDDKHITRTGLWLKEYEVELLEKKLKENQQLKKQKDDVANRIKVLGKFDGTKCTRGFKMMTADFNDLLRMLGEIDE